MEDFDVEKCQWKEKILIRHFINFIQKQNLIKAHLITFKWYIMKIIQETWERFELYREDRWPALDDKHDFYCWAKEVLKD